VAVRRVVEVAGMAFGSLLLYFIAPLDGRFSEVLAFVLVLVVCAMLLPLAARRSRQILVSDQPILVAAQALFTALTLFVVAFSAVYYVLAVDLDRQIEGIETKIDALYFTVTVLATVGFGDITPVGQGARALVTFQMAANLALLAVAVRLVSWALSHRESTKQHAGAIVGPPDDGS
jgi:voltage-gated potassium channel